MQTTVNIVDNIETKLKEFMRDNEKAPTLLVLDIYSLSELKEFLGVAIYDEISTYHGFEIAVKTGEDITNMNYVKFFFG